MLQIDSAIGNGPNPFYFKDQEIKFMVSEKQHLRCQFSLDLTTQIH